ncbi:MAG: TonB-dependent receptor, partial [Candidatus Zixiibacteriota bacterium]
IQPTARQSLTRRELETAPQVGEDIYRAVSRLPGVAAEDFSSRFYVRGGEYEEVLATLDGLHLYEPFHLRDFKGGLFSAIDGSAIESIELITGGFTAEYGDRASGVFNITSHRPPTDRRKVSAAVSFMNARLMTEGTFANNRGSWLLSARRGYLDVLLKIAGEGENFRPTYYDVMGKMQYQLSDRHILSTHVFHAGDRFKVVEDAGNDADTLVTSYDNSYAWFNLKSQLHDRLLGQTVLSVGHVKHDRYGFSYWASQQLEDRWASDKENFTVLGAKSDWEYELSDKYMLKTGFDVRALRADYDYIYTDHVWVYSVDGLIELERIDSVQAALEPKGNQIGAYLSHRMQVAPALTLEVGGRYDRHSYTDDEHFSPRLNMALQLDENTTLRGGWGYYYQAQRIDELSPGDKLTEFWPAERAEHKTIGLERLYESGIRMRIEAYHKKYTDLRPETRNTFDELQEFPETDSDRQIVYRDGSTAQGLEVYFKREKGSKFTWCLTYAIAKIEDQIDRIHYTNILYADGLEYTYNDTYPNPRDQRHTLYIDASYRPHLNWQFNLAWNYHSGWPYTGVYLASGTNEAGDDIVWINQDELLARNYPPYSRLDLRVNRYFDIWGGRLTAFLEVINVLGKRNVRGYEYDIQSSGDRLYISEDAQTAFGTLPVLGVTYSLNM